MKALIICDSVFGNTEKVAQSIGAVLGPQGQVKTLLVGQVTMEQLRGLEVLIVGPPTRSFRPTPAISQFLKALPKNHLAGINVATFDTRIWLNTIDSAAFRFLVDKGGYAANTMAKALTKKGGNPIVPPEGFLVTGEQGPLKEGELERAAEWAREILITM